MDGSPASLTYSAVATDPVTLIQIAHIEPEVTVSGFHGSARSPWTMIGHGRFLGALMQCNGFVIALLRLAFALAPSVPLQRHQLKHTGCELPAHLFRLSRFALAFAKPTPA